MDKNILEYLKASRELDIIILKHMTIHSCDEVWFYQAINKFKRKNPNFIKLWEE